MKNFEDDLNRLEELTQSIKKSDIGIEEALKDFEEGIKLAKGLQKQLDDIEGKIQILMEGKSEETESPAPAKTKKSKSSKSAKEDAPELSLFDINTEVNGTRNA